MAGRALALLLMQVAAAAAFSCLNPSSTSATSRSPLAIDAIRPSSSPRVVQLRPRLPTASTLRAQIEFSDWDGEDLVKMQKLDPMDEAGYRMHESSDNYIPFEGDIVEYVVEGYNTANMGMVVEDSRDGEVKVRKLLRRDGDGEFDEWRCVVAKSEAVVEVPVYAVRYVGSCTDCSEENGVC